MKQILIFGGTRFIGRNLLERLSKLDGYELTMFNRGITDAELFPEINRVTGDRRQVEDLKMLLQQDWDVIIDISAYWAGALQRQFEQHSGKIGRYIFISTSSHYQLDLEKPSPIPEGREIVACSEDQKNSEEPYAFYNENKAECERILQGQPDLDYIILRPSLVIGKYDYTDRLYYWLYKVKHQDKILVGNEGNAMSSFTNVNDLVDLIIYSIDAQPKHQIFNTSSFHSSIRTFIENFGQVLGTCPNLISGSTAFLQENDVQQWTSLPLWLDSDFHRTDNSRAQKEFDYQFSNLEQTISQLVDFYGKQMNWPKPNTRPEPISAEMEATLIEKLEGARANLSK